MANESQQRYLTVLLLGGVTDFAFGFVTSKTPPGIWKSTLQSAAVKVCTAHPTQDAVHCLEGPARSLYAGSYRRACVGAQEASVMSWPRTGWVSVCSNGSWQRQIQVDMCPAVLREMLFRSPALWWEPHCGQPSAGTVGEC